MRGPACRRLALLALLVACRSPAEPPPAPPEAAAENTPDPSALVITDPSQREAAVGQRVVVVGTLRRSKMPQVNGVDVGADDALSDRRVRVEGILRKRVVEPAEPEAGGLPVATRGPGTYYSVVDPETGQLARPRPE